MKRVIAVVVATALSGCASTADKVAASYVSPLQYQSYDCDQIAAEAARVHASAVSTGAQLNKAASNDAGITAAGVILFWPALFFLGGNQQKESEYGRLRGEYEALERASIAKKCENRFVPTEPIVPVNEQKDAMADGPSS